MLRGIAAGEGAAAGKTGIRRGGLALWIISSMSGAGDAARAGASIGKAAAAAVLLAASAAAMAQARPDAGQILEQTREPLRLPPPREADVLPRPPEPKPALPASPELRVTVKSFVFTGNTIFSDAFLQPIVAEYLGRELGFDDLIEAATQVRAYYRERGYFLAQAYLPEQTIRNGVVEIGIIEGRIGEITLVRRPATRLREGLLAGILGAHWQEGQIITETGLEKPLLLINDLPTAAVTSEIRPSRTVGAADLRVSVDRGVGLVNGFVDFDNHGNRFTGEYRLGANLSVNNPLTLGDQASFRGFRTEGMWFSRVNYLVPVWHYGTRAGLSYAEFSYNLGEGFEALDADGNGDVSSIFVFHPVIRTRNSNLILQGAYEDKRLSDRTAATGTVEDRAIDSVKAGVVGDFRDVAFGGGLNSYAITLTRGDLRLFPEALLAADQGATGRRTQGKFSKLNIDFRRLQRLSENANLLVSFFGQEASKNLASAEKISLGGPNAVRAYPVGEANSDSAMVVQIDLRRRLEGVTFFGGDVTLSLHYDWGWGKINQDSLPTDTENERSISGFGVGASLGNEGDFIVRATLSDRIHKSEPPTSDPAIRHPRAWVQAVKWF